MDKNFNFSYHAGIAGENLSMTGQLVGAFGVVCFLEASLGFPAPLLHYGHLAVALLQVVFMVVLVNSSCLLVVLGSG